MRGASGNVRSPAWSTSRRESFRSFSAVRIDGVAYFVDGTHIDDHGDAHAQDGFCNSIRHADVEGEIVDGRFVARSFRLVAG